MVPMMQRVALAVAVLLSVSLGVVTSSSTFSPTQLGLRLGNLVTQLGRLLPLPDIYEELGVIAVLGHTTEGLQGDLEAAQKAAEAWLELTPDDAPWHGRLVLAHRIIDAAQTTVRSLPEGRLVDRADQELTEILRTLGDLGNVLEALAASIEDFLPSDEAHWHFAIGYLCGPLLELPGFAPAVPHEERRFLADHVPPQVPSDVREALQRLLELLPEPVVPWALLWSEADARAAERAAREVLVGLGELQVEEGG